MKRLLLWTFDRGSFQWDIMCLLILAFLFLIPRDMFHDVPDFMKVSDGNTPGVTRDRNGNTIFTVKLGTPGFLDTQGTRNTAKAMLGVVGDEPRIQPIRDWTGRLIGYAIWNEKKEKQP